MSLEQLKAFLAKVKGDTSLQEKLKAAADADAALAIAKEAGFSISAEDFKNTRVELSEEELESVAGGTTVVLGGCAWIATGLARKKDYSNGNLLSDNCAS